MTRNLSILLLTLLCAGCAGSSDHVILRSSQAQTNAVASIMPPGAKAMALMPSAIVPPTNIPTVVTCQWDTANADILGQFYTGLSGSADLIHWQPLAGVLATNLHYRATVASSEPHLCFRAWNATNNVATNPATLITGIEIVPFPSN